MVYKISLATTFYNIIIFLKTQKRCFKAAKAYNYGIIFLLSDD